MQKKFPGKVVTVRQASDKMKYTVIEIGNKVNLNYRLFIPGDEFKVGDKVDVTVEISR